MDTQGAANPPNTLVPPPQGSSIKPAHTVRTMRELNIYEEELDHVSLLNSLSAWCFSAASGSALFAIGLITNASMQEDVSQRAWGVLFVGVPIGVLLSAGFLVAAFWALKAKGSRVSAMKRQAVDIEPQVPSAIDALATQAQQSTPDMAEPPPQPAS